MRKTIRTLDMHARRGTMSFRLCGGLAATAALALVCTGAHAAVDLIPGKIHIIKGGKLTKMVSKPTAAFTVPAPGGPGDPTVNGGSLDVFDTADLAGFSTSLPSGKWKGLGKPAGIKGYKYTGDGTPADPCKVVLVNAKVIKFVCKDDQNLNPPLTGRSGIILAIGADDYCAEFGGTQIKNQTDLFTFKDAPAPASCP